VGRPRPPPRGPRTGNARRRANAQDLGALGAAGPRIAPGQRAARLPWRRRRAPCGDPRAGASELLVTLSDDGGGHGQHPLPGSRRWIALGPRPRWYLEIPVPAGTQPRRGDRARSSELLAGVLVCSRRRRAHLVGVPDAART